MISLINVTRGITIWHTTKENTFSWQTVIRVACFNRRGRGAATYNQVVVDHLTLCFIQLPNVVCGDFKRRRVCNRRKINHVGWALLVLVVMGKLLSHWASVQAEWRWLLLAIMRSKQPSAIPCVLAQSENKSPCPPLRANQKQSRLCKEEEK